VLGVAAMICNQPYSRSQELASVTEFTSRLLVGFLVLSCLAHAQAFRTFRTLLSPVPVAAFNANVVGTGSVTATLTGNRLAISGTYQGLAHMGIQAMMPKTKNRRPQRVSVRQANGHVCGASVSAGCTKQQLEVKSLCSLQMVDDLEEIARLRVATAT
jgi:hypothetical protein